MSAPKSNQFAREWTLENARERLFDALEFAKNNPDCLCLQDARMHTLIPRNTYYRLLKEYKELADINDEIKDVIISRINRNALDKETPSPASPSIWRMKQLGEKDENYSHNVHEILKQPNITVTNKEVADELNEFFNESD